MMRMETLSCALCPRVAAIVLFSSLPIPRDSTALRGKKPKHTPPLQASCDVVGTCPCSYINTQIHHLERGKYMPTDLVSNRSPPPSPIEQNPEVTLLQKHLQFFLSLLSSLDMCKNGLDASARLSGPH